MAYVSPSSVAIQPTFSVIVCKGHKVPMILVVKCGNPDEEGGPKPGNRGKRDSQLILMNFFSRVTYNDRMTPLDYDLFQKIHWLMGATPDFFELCLMVSLFWEHDGRIGQLTISLFCRWMQIPRSINQLCAILSIVWSTTI